MKQKQRLDEALYERGLCESLDIARAIIMAGRVYSREVRLDKPGITIAPGEPLTVRQSTGYASRGALKFERAVDTFSVDLTGVTAMDIGAAAGGFTDIMLRAGAERVYAIDVGYGQMDWRLRNDPRVVVMERTNARHLKKEQFSIAPAFAGMDVSFISVLTVLPALLNVMEAPKRVVSLIKPQFEAPKELVGAKGVIREAKTHNEVLTSVIRGAEKLGLFVHGLDFSPIKGPEGNIEFLVDWLPFETTTDDVIIFNVVERAHEVLGAGREGGWR